MSCNAWNHPPDCECGWGGDTIFKNHHGNDSLYSVSAVGFLTPNARCPICKKPVYFYCSPNGGRVFFDEIGVPWPKHPCTENNGINISSFSDIIEFTGAIMNVDKAMLMALELVKYAEKTAGKRSESFINKRAGIVKEIYDIRAQSGDDGLVQHTGEIPTRDIAFMLEAKLSESLLFERFTADQVNDGKNVDKNTEANEIFSERAKLLRLLISNLRGRRNNCEMPLLKVVSTNDSDE